MKKLMILLLGLIALLQPIKSVAADWPGTGSCSTTLQLCIDAVSAGSSIIVKTDGFANVGILNIDKGLTLAAGVGYHPKFNLTHLVIAAGPPKNVTIEGFIFQNTSYIEATIAVDDVLIIQNNQWVMPSSASGNFEGIQIKSSPFLTIGNTATVKIIGNDLHGAGYNGIFGFIDIFHFTTGNLVVQIFDNHLQIENAGTVNPAIVIINAGNGQIDAQIIANNITAQYNFLQFRQDDPGAQAQMNIGVISNVMTGGKILGVPVAIHELLKSQVSQGTFNGIFANNTLDGGGGNSTGFNFLNHTTTKAGSINISKNIIVNTNKAYQGPASGSSVAVTSSGDNVFFNEGSTVGLSLVASDINQAPLFINEGINYALQTGSPAIDKANIFSANTLYTTGFMLGAPRIDADGLRRYKGDKIDAGAIEWGDRHLFHQTNNAFFNTSASLDAAFNNDASARTIVTPVWNYENLPGVYHDHPVGIYRSGSIWGIINEDQISLPTDVKFHIFYPYGVASSGSLLNGLHQWTKDATTATGFELSSALLNNNFNSGVFTSNFWDGNNSPIYNLHSLEVGYKFTTNKWYLANSDGVNMPVNAKFFTYNQDYSRNVFNHKVTVGNTQGNVTVIDHPLLNGNPCALPTVTQVAPFVILGPAFGNNPHHIGVFYSVPLAKWAIFNQDIATFNTTAIGATSFNVMVDPQQVYECNTKILFSDGFE